MKSTNTYKLQKSLGIGAALLGAVAGASGQVLYSDNFDNGSGDASNWHVNVNGNSDATFGFDYSTVGIPAAPNSGGTTVGVRLRANFAATGVLGGVSISPTGQSFGGSYKLTYDFWSNMNGSLSGSTQITGAGVGTSGTIAQTTATTHPTSVYFGQTGDGGNGTSTQDYRAYSSAVTGGSSSAGGVGYTAASGIFAAGTDITAIDSANAYYASLGGHTVPAAQTAITSTQAGTAAAGAPGWAWHSGEIDFSSVSITYKIDGLTIATIANTGLTLDGGDISLLQADVNSGVSGDVTAPTYLFGLFDDVIVTQTPEPATYALLATGVAGMFFMRRRVK